ncbi:hypothetical protein DFH09DRAFT_1070282 [Mycena vulgaris]|nr:hypothetical protein DFH09DRAFT_1070282 [Mycena vulgaris]
MPSQPTITQPRLNIINYLNTTLKTLEKLSHSFKTPFLEAILNTTHSLVISVQTIRKNQDDCTQLIERVHELLYAIIHLHLNSDVSGELPPSMLSKLGEFTTTLHKIHAFVEAQRDKSRIRSFFRQGEMSALLKDCNIGLEQALNTFKIDGVDILNKISDMQQSTQKIHEEVLELIESLSDGSSSDNASSINQGLMSSQNSLLNIPSSNSLSLLPSEPKIFHGRELELSIIIQAFHQGTPRIAILGAGGMGKTSLARAVLHHEEVTARYGQHRFFVACDTVSTHLQLASLIGSYVGLKPARDLTQALFHLFASGPPSLLLLDNLETIWEPAESHRDLEGFLALLTDIPHLALIITMRGAERPSKVRWTHPFLEPLKPLTQEAARQTFIDIADDSYDWKDVEKILILADNMPLAVDLLAHLVDYEGISNVLTRWETERTSLISEGYDKGSNLNLSISMSLSSPRITSLDARHLLSLLSILPDGLSDGELLQVKFPIEHILACKTALLRTSLAYTDDQRRLRTLVPIREYMEKNYPPSNHHVRALLGHFHALLEVYQTFYGTIPSIGVVPQIKSNFANIQNVLHRSLNQDNPDLVKTIYSTCHLNFYSGTTGRGRIHLMNNVPNVLPQPQNHRLEAYFITALFGGWNPISNIPGVVDQALENFLHFDDPNLKCNFYNNIGEYHIAHKRDIALGMHYCEAALSLSISTENLNAQCRALLSLAWIREQAGDYAAGQAHAYESQRLAKISANLYMEAWALRMESVCWKSLGRYNHSILLFERARYLLDLCNISGGDMDYSILISLAEVHSAKSEYLEARDIQIQLLQNIPIQNPHYALALLNVAQIDIEIGGSRGDVQKNIDTARSANTMGDSMTMLACDATLADLSLREGDELNAKTLLQKCLQLSQGRLAQAMTYCLERLANVSRWSVADHMTSTWTMIFLGHAIISKQKLEIYKALQFLGDVYLAEGDQHTAISLFTVALEGFTHMDVHCSRAECMLRLGDVATQDGDLSKAAELWNKAKPLFERSFQANQVAQINERLITLPRDMTERNLALLSAFHPPAGLGEQVIGGDTAEGMENRVLNDQSDVVPMVA